MLKIIYINIYICGVYIVDSDMRAAEEQCGIADIFNIWIIFKELVNQNLKKSGSP